MLLCTLPPFKVKQLTATTPTPSAEFSLPKANTNRNNAPEAQLDTNDTNRRNAPPLNPNMNSNVQTGSNSLSREDSILVESLTSETKFSKCNLMPYILVKNISGALSSTVSMNPLSPVTDPFIISNNYHYRLSDAETTSLLHEVKFLINFKKPHSQSHIFGLASVITSIISYLSKNKLTLKEKESIIKLVPRYNRLLNNFKQVLLVSDDSALSTNIKTKRVILQCLRPLCHGHDLVFKKWKPLNINSNIEVEAHAEPQEVISYRSSNYDGLPVTSQHTVVIRAPTSAQNISDEITNTPLSFGFESREDFFDVIKMVINDSVPSQVKYEVTPRKMTSNKIGQYSVTDTRSRRHCVFSLNLKFPHNRSYTIINSSSQKLLHWLIHGLDPKDPDIHEYANANRQISLQKRFKLGFCAEFHDLVTKKIKQLSGQIIAEDYPFSNVDCYRQSCCHRTIYWKAAPNSKPQTFRCERCNIAEFCNSCGLTSHGSSACNVDHNEASDEFVQQNTKYCPNRERAENPCPARILKNEGCNHMRCTVCNVHFCWLCLETYTLDEINGHYANMNPYNPVCRGLERIAKKRAEEEARIRAEEEARLRAEEGAGILEDDVNVAFLQVRAEPDDIPHVVESDDDDDLVNELDAALFEAINGVVPVVNNNLEMDNLIAEQLRLGGDNIDFDDEQAVNAFLEAVNQQAPVQALVAEPAPNDHVQEQHNQQNNQRRHRRAHRQFFNDDDW